MSEPTTAVDFVQNYLPAKLVELFDLTQLHAEKDTFVDAQLRKHFSDILYRVALKSGGEAYLYLLFEHKSRPDKQVRLQVLRYMTRIWEKEWKKRKRLSPIIPIVFYHGVEKWHYSTEFADLIEETPAALQPYIPHFHHLLTDLSNYTDEEIRGEVWLRVNLLLLKHIFDQDLGRQLPDILGLLYDLAQQESGLEMLQTLLLYIANANEAVTAKVFEAGVIAASRTKGKELMATLAQKWKDEGRAEGLEQGIEQGIEQGLNAQRQTLLHLLNWRFQIPEVQQIAYHQQFNQIRDLTLLTRLVDDLLSAQELTAFDQKLQATLSVADKKGLDFLG